MDQTGIQSRVLDMHQGFGCPIAQGPDLLQQAGRLIRLAAVIDDRRPAQTILDDRQIELAAQQLLAVAEIGTIGAAPCQPDRPPTQGRPGDRRDPCRTPLSSARQAEDLALAGRIKLALAGIALPDFDPARVKPVVAEGVVYLLGLVTPQEAEPVAERARRIPGVKTLVLLFEYWNA